MHRIHHSIGVATLCWMLELNCLRLAVIHIVMRANQAGTRAVPCAAAKSRPWAIQILTHLGQRVRKVRREGSIDVWLQLRQVDLNELVILSALIWAQVLPEGVRQLGYGLPTRGHQVIIHALVVGEHGGGGTNLSTHVADCAHACIAKESLRCEYREPELSFLLRLHMK